MGVVFLFVGQMINSRRVVFFFVDMHGCCDDDDDDDDEEKNEEERFQKYQPRDLRINLYSPFLMMSYIL